MDEEMMHCSILDVPDVLDVVVLEPGCSDDTVWLDVPLHAAPCNIPCGGIPCGQLCGGAR